MYLSKEVVMGWRNRGNKHSHGYRDPGSSSGWDGAFCANVAQPVVGMKVRVIRGRVVYGCGGHLAVIDAAADQRFTGIKHSCTHETASLNK